MDKTILLLILHIAVLAISSITNSIQSDLFNGYKLLNDVNEGRITILENCQDKVYDEGQKICSDWKEQCTDQNRLFLISIYPYNLQLFILSRGSFDRYILSGGNLKYFYEITNVVDNSTAPQAEECVLAILCNWS